MNTPNELYPLALRMLQMNYALQIFGYLKRRNDTDLIHEGEVLMRHMQHYRQCLPENSKLYYDILKPFTNLLFRYPQVEENASVSGFYEAQRGQLLANIRAVIKEMEQQQDLMDYLSSMLTKIIGDATS